jgi:dTDP-4-amino-4,6-dideoxygalactose transaminase
VLSVNLKYLDKWNQLRIEIANEYNFFFRDNDITVINDTHGSVYHHYAIRSKNRDQTRKLLTDNGIGTEIHYPEPASKTFEKLTKMNVTENQEVSLRLANETLSIPLSPWMKKEEMNYVKTIFQKPEILETIY